MSQLPRDPSPHELLDRIRKLETRLTEAERRAAEYTDIVMRYIDYLVKERDFSMEVHQAQYNRVVSVQERLTMLENKVVPGFGRTLHNVQDVVGDFDEWHQINPLDRRKDSSPNDPRADNQLDRREKPSDQP